MAAINERLWLHTVLDHQLSVYKETEGQLIIVMTLNQWMKVDIQMEYSSDWLYGPSIGEVTKSYL